MLIEGRHLQILWARVSGTLEPVQQHAWVTTLLEIAVLWVPLMPALGILLCGALASGLLLFQFGVASRGVELSRDHDNSIAELSSPYLRISRSMAELVQLWYA